MGAGKMKLPEKPIYYLDEQDELLPEVVEVLNYSKSTTPRWCWGPDIALCRDQQTD